MKATENKSSTTATLQAKQEQTPFFKKEGQDGFFSKSTEKTAPFFKPRPPLGGRGAIQPKLKIGQPNDKYEKEADSVADTVVQKLAAPPSPLKGESAHTNTPPSGGRGGVQRKCANCEQEEKLQKKEDKEEISLKEESIQRKPIFESNDDTSPDALSGLGGQGVQRKCADCGATLHESKEEEVQKKEDVTQASLPEEEPLMMKSEGGETVGTSTLQNQLNSSKGKGASLPENTRTDMESTIGADFSGVNIHTDSNAVQMNKDLGAKAFTHGSDVYFNQGQYDTSSSGGQHLLAHELTHTVQQGAAASTPAVQKEGEETASAIPAGAPAAALDITHRFSPNATWKAYLEENPANTDVRVKIGNDYEGIITVNQTQAPTEGSTGKYELARNQRLYYLNVNGLSFLNPLRNAGVTPILVLRNFGEDQLTKAFLSVKMGEEPVGDVLGLIQGFNAQMEAMGFLGLDRLQVPAEGVQNRFEQGRLVFQVSQLATVVDGFIEAGGGIGIVGNSLTFDLVSNINIEGIAQGEFTIGRGEDGQLHGRAEITAQLANVEALLLVEYQSGSVTIQGTGTINSEKFTGSITLLVTDRARSREMMHAALGVQALEGEAAATPTQSPKTPQNQVLAGWGEVTATITPWLQGSAKIGIDHQGHVTMIGELSVPDEIELMEQRGKKIQLVDFEIRAGYGVPLVGQVFIFGGLGLFINAGFGPLVLRDIRLTGTYSTDPSILQEFSITGALGINAFAVLGLEAEAGVGVTLLGHDVKAGINATAAAGLRAYAEARPTFEYTESRGEAGGKVGEAHLKGHFEAAAQLFLMLSGAFFVELDSPWWSPAPDDRWDYPLGSVEYPIGDSMGIGADMDWLVGSDQVPELNFTPVEFNPEKFTADVMADPPPGRGNGGDAEEQGTWTDGPGGGGLEGNPDVREGGEGLPQSRQQEENLRNLPDEQKYMRGLSEISDIAESREKPTVALVRTKINRVKQRYGLDQVRIQDENDNNVTIFVRHALQDNSRNLVEIPVMSEAERTRMLSEAMTDLRDKENRTLDEDGTIEESAARAMLQAWSREHPLVESARVIDGGETWDYFIDVGDKHSTEKGKLKKSGGELDHTKVRDEFKTKSGEKHKIYLRKDGEGGFELVIESTPTIYKTFINNFNIPDDASEKIKQIKKEALALGQKIDVELDKLTTGNEKPEYTEKEYDKMVDLLADYTEQLMNGILNAEVPEEKIVWGPKFDGAFGSSVAVNYLSSTTKGARSSRKPYEKHSVLNQRKGESGERPYYLRGHLLNANLHGLNDWKNLAPITYTANTAHKDKIETALTSHLDKKGNPVNDEKRVFEYIVIAQYGRGVNETAKQNVDKSGDDYVKNNKVIIKQIIDAEAYVPKRFVIKAVELFPDENGSWVKEENYFNDTIENKIEQNDPTKYNVGDGKVVEKKKSLHINEVLDNEDLIRKWFNERNANAILEAIEDYRLEINNHKNLQRISLNVLGESNKGKIPINALINRIKFNRDDE